MPACPACGSPAAPGKSFCADCGSPLDLTSARTRARRPDREPAEEGGTGDAAGRGRFIPGTRIAGRYRIVGRLGRGGMGVVYRAEDLKLGQTVALKFLPMQVEEDPARLERLLGEVRLARQVGHPNVCRVYDAGEVDGRHFISMEYVDGEDLATLLRRIGRIPGEKAVELARQICAGLHAAHDQGILHRDLKPANIMIDGRGRARITDFGLAAPRGELAEHDIGSGTPAYMAPEQLQGRKVTERSDIYALGLVLHELFTGRRVLGSGEREESPRPRPESTPSTPTEGPGALDPAVERVILRCLERDPARRPGSALEVAAALPGGDPLAAALAAGETPSPEMVAAAGGERTMHPGAALALAASSVAAFALAVTVGGSQSLRAWLPELKPPEVMIDRAREIIGELGYTEPPYAEPADSAFGFEVRREPLREIRDASDASGRWEGLADPSAGVLGIWYRQSPRPLRPAWRGGAGIAGTVDPWNPFPRTTGEIVVVQDPAGRLETFVAVPRRFIDPGREHSPYDWSRPFRLAGLEISEFRPDKPRYQRFMHLEERAAWVPAEPGAGYRIEAGASEGRLSLFVKLREGAAERLAAEPGETPESPPDVIGWTFFILLIAGAFMAWANHRRGSVDHRAALRVGVLYAGITLLARILPSHEILHVTALAFALLSGTGTAVIYMALEPYARAIWPSMLASWHRLLVPTGRGWRDPAVGRAVLVGLAVGAAHIFLAPLLDLAAAAWSGTPAPPGAGEWEALRGTRAAWGVIATRMTYGVAESIMVALLLVLARRLVKRPAPAVILAGLFWIAPDAVRVLLGEGPDGPVALIRHFVFLLITLALLFWVLLRWGLVASIAMSVTAYLGNALQVTAWDAWHARPAVYGLVVISALALYGAWAATPGRRPGGEAPRVAPRRQTEIPA